MNEFAERSREGPRASRNEFAQQSREGPRASMNEFAQPLTFVICQSLIVSSGALNPLKFVFSYCHSWFAFKQGKYESSTPPNLPEG